MGRICSPTIKPGEPKVPPTQVSNTGDGQEIVCSGCSLIALVVVALLMMIKADLECSGEFSHSR